MQNFQDYIIAIFVIWLWKMIFQYFILNEISVFAIYILSKVINQFLNYNFWDLLNHLQT